jgi:hypothetical protein
MIQKTEKMTDAAATMEGHHAAGKPVPSGLIGLAEEVSESSAE